MKTYQTSTQSFVLKERFVFFMTEIKSWEEMGEIAN